MKRGGRRKIIALPRTAATWGDKATQNNGTGNIRSLAIHCYNIGLAAITRTTTAATTSITTTTCTVALGSHLASLTGPIPR